MIRGESLTAEEVGALENVTADEQKQFARQAGLTDGALLQVEAMGQAMAPIVEKYVKRCVQPLVDRIVELENNRTQYEGVYQRAQSYRRGSIVTHKRGAWVALWNTNVGDVPDEGPAWQLFVPAGRDAKDAK
jgi:hypothetical protein